MTRLLENLSDVQNLVAYTEGTCSISKKGGGDRLFIIEEARGRREGGLPCHMWKQP